MFWKGVVFFCNCNLQSLEMSDSFDDNLKHDVEEAYESVKDTRVVLVVSTLFSFLLSESQQKNQ